MPSLIPQKALALPEMPDLPAVFKDAHTAATRERVINFLFPLYEQYSEIDVEKAWSTTTIHEELHIPMPTTAAYFAEVSVCNAILDHARGALPDAAMEVILRTFLDTHIWIYNPDGPRTNKAGRWGDWTRGVPLYHLRFTQPLSGDLLKREACFVVNPIQAWLVRLCEERRGGENFSLQKI